MKTRAAERAFPLNQTRDSLRAAAKQARSCESAGSHRGKAQVTFSNSGKVSDVKLVPPVAAPTTQTCVERAFGNIQVAPFDGPPITLQKTFFLR